MNTYHLYIPEGNLDHSDLERTGTFESMAHAAKEWEKELSIEWLDLITYIDEHDTN